MRYNEDDRAALEEEAARAAEKRELERIARKTRARMRRAWRLGYKTDVEMDREQPPTEDDPTVA